MRKLVYIAFTVIIFVLLVFFTSGDSSLNSHNENVRIVWGKWDKQKINKLLNQSQELNSYREKIDFISEKFLETPYKAHTLIGSEDDREVLTIDLGNMDCFTYLDYVESLSFSENFEDFKNILKKVRYRDGQVEYEKRRHFFSDWLSNENISDVTELVAPDDFETVIKRLNRKSEMELYLIGIPLVERKISYIPPERINSEIEKNLKTGDYIGIYTEAPGLDVSHTGIFIRKDEKSFLRHASSRKSSMHVVDDDFNKYISKTPGIVVYRKSD